MGPTCVTHIEIFHPPKQQGTKLKLSTTVVHKPKVNCYKIPPFCYILLICLAGKLLVDPTHTKKNDACLMSRLFRRFRNSGCIREKMIHLWISCPIKRGSFSSSGYKLRLIGLRIYHVMVFLFVKSVTNFETRSVGTYTKQSTFCTVSIRCFTSVIEQEYNKIYFICDC